MANIYASAGRFQDADTCRILVRDLGKKTGLTWCEFNGKVIEFAAHDTLKHVPEYKEQIKKRVRYSQSSCSYKNSLRNLE